MGVAQGICFLPARGAYFSIKTQKNPVMKGSASRGRPPGRGGGLAMLVLFFALERFLMFLGCCYCFFCYLLSISNGFWEDFGRVLVDLGRV